MDKKLFSGTPGFLGGLSNEEKLVKLCPDEFKTENPWSHAASLLFFCGGKTTDWKWRSPDKAERGRQRACFEGLLRGFGLQHESKEAIAGWMLSEMLSEVPEVETSKLEEKLKKP